MFYDVLEDNDEFSDHPPCAHCGQQAEVWCLHTKDGRVTECDKVACRKCAEETGWFINDASYDNENLGNCLVITVCPEHLNEARIRFYGE